MTAARGALPKRNQSLDDVPGRVLGDQCSVQGTDRCAEDQVRPDVGLEESAQHADLHRAEHTAPAEDEGGAGLSHRAQGAGTAASERICALTRAVAWCSAQNDRIGTVPHSNVVSVN